MLNTLIYETSHNHINPSVFSVIAIAQTTTEGTLKFLGIPIDGSKDNMISRIKEKGFRFDSYNDCLRGQFNGKDVEVYVVTNHEVVDRIYVEYPEMSESRVITEYNILLGQFNRNKKYIALEENEKIPDNEDLSYEMTVKNKKYGAAFMYISPDLFTEEEIDNLHTMREQVEGMSSEEMQVMGQAMADSLQTRTSEISIEDTMKTINKLMSLVSGNVWFTIHEHYGQYQIGIYYDNLKNRPNGEDL